MPTDPAGPASEEAAAREQVSGTSELDNATSRALVKISVWQTVLSLLGIFVAIVALYAALTESEEVRRQTSAAVWPYVQLSVETHISHDSARFGVTLNNAGVGPARLQAMQVIVAGEPVKDWQTAISRLSGAREIPFRQNYSSQRVLSPGEKLLLFEVEDQEVASALISLAGEGQASVMFCYCSIFDDCWVAGSGSLVAAEPVERCPDFGAEAFQH